MAESGELSRCRSINEVLMKAVETGATVLVRMRDGKLIRGRIVTYDQHVNLMLDDAHEVVNVDGEERHIRRGRMIIRGENVLFIMLLE